MKIVSASLVGLSFGVFSMNGCADSVGTLKAREDVAARVYRRGSSFAGDGRSLLLFPDMRWEEWASTCTDHWRIVRGRYEIVGDRLTLWGGREESLSFSTIAGREILIPEAAGDATYTEVE